MSDDFERLKARLLAKRDRRPRGPAGLSSGSTLLNLAMTGTPDVGWPRGAYHLFVGDSNSGKTWFALAALAEASIGKDFKDYELHYDGVERGDLMDKRKYFGRALESRLQYHRSETVEGMYDELDRLLRAGKKIVYVLDSMDSLTTEAELKKSAGNRKARAQENGEVKGSYGDGKAKVNSSRLRQLIGPLDKTGSILLFINQTRDNIGFGAQFRPKTRSGGLALGFYASVELWSSVRERIKRRAAGKDRNVGTRCRIKVERTRVTGRSRTVDVPIYFSAGIDEVGSMVDWLIEEKHWAAKEGVVTAPEFDFRGSQEKLVQLIEDGNREPELRGILKARWDAIEMACEVKRKLRYE